MPLVTIIYKVLGPIGLRAGPKQAHDDSFMDRMNYYYTNAFLLMFTIIVSTKTYVGAPIECWCPAEFTHNEIKYINDVCWISNTFYIPFSKQIPPQYEVRRTDEVTYYQWVPVFFLLAALILKLPRYVWKIGVQMSGIGLRPTLNLIKESQSLASDARDKHLRNVATFIGQWTSSSRPYRAGIFSMARERLGNYCMFGCGRHYGNYFVSLSIFTRLLYCVNSICMLFFLNEFLGNKFYLFGYEVIRSLLEGRDWVMSPRFPRITICDFDLRQMTNVQRWSVQCVLPVNLYNEVFFIFLWFWFTLLSCMNIINCCWSILAAAWPVNMKSFAEKYLLINNLDKEVDEEDTSTKKNLFSKLVTKFVNEYLRPDGIFLLKLMCSNTRTVGVADIVKYMWQDFRSKMNTYQKPQCQRNGYHRRPEYQQTTWPLMNENMRQRYKEYQL